MAADHRQAGSLWTPEEDVVLLRHVAKYGTKHWGYLQTSGVLPHRDQKACCNRFILLKRKFFQARAKGQRLTFPVVPQPEVTSSLRTSSPSSSTRVSPTNSLGVSRHSSFKRASHSGPTTSLRMPDADLIEASVSFGKPTEDTSSQDFAAERALLQRTLENLPEAGIRHSSFQAFPGRASLSPLPKAAPVKTEDFSADVMPALLEAPPSSARSSLIQANLESSFASLTAAPQSGVQSAVWRCFNPTSLDSLLAEASTEDYGGLSHGKATESSGQLAAGVVSTASDALLQQLSGAGSAAVGPDAMLEQVATAPVQTLFGARSLLAANVEPAIPVEMSSAWESPAACMDLWDLMRNAASV